MKRTVRLREEADQDLAIAATWYEQQRSGLARLLDKVQSAFQFIAEQPLMYPIVHRNIRRALMSGFPFGIYFRVERSYIVVLAIMHASRDPIRWQSRT